MNASYKILAVSAIISMVCFAAFGQASPRLDEINVLHEQPAVGVYYNRYEPAFYTGFAPRSRNPQRLHLHIGRGNQLRVTLVLSDAVIENYARDLLFRYTTYKANIADGRIVLTQNTGFEEFERMVKQIDLKRLISEEENLTVTELRRRNLKLLEQLNPGRIFHIRLEAEELFERWVKKIRSADAGKITRERRLELVNEMLPTRLFVKDLSPAAEDGLAALVAGVVKNPAKRRSLIELFVQVIERAANSIYPFKGGVFDFYEFTAIYPIGSVNEYTKHKGRQIPLYPTPGRRKLTTHQRTKTVDHIPTKVAYGYFPWLPYMHVGTRLHNSFHTLWWKMPLGKIDFLPQSWAESTAGSRDGKPFKFLWLLSRGPMSHGCTHLNAGHILELRQLLPSETEKLYEVEVFINKSSLFDVFDIEGELNPKAVGVRYYVAYSLKDLKPHRLRAPQTRRAFYDWLYGGEAQFDPNADVFFENAVDAGFLGESAVTGKTYSRIPLYEAEYKREELQFYRLISIPFARELRKTSVSHPLEGYGSPE